jgi:hypothetical protein
MVSVMERASLDHPAPEPRSRVDSRRLSITSVGMSLGLFFSITYVLCVLYGLAVTDIGMHQLLAMVIPAFTWLTWGSFVWGLVVTFIFGWYVAIVFVPLYRFFAVRFG